MAEHTSVLVEAFSENPATCKVVKVKTPKPGPNQVLVKLKCSPINPSDLLCITGTYADGPKTFPFVPGFEGMGLIHELGEGVTGLSVGQRVFVSNLLGGTWQEYMLAPASSVIPLPDSLPDEVGAQFFINPWTVYGMLDVLKPPKGEYVLQTAAGSTLGKMFIQFAHHQGIKTINLVRRNEQKEELKALGADEVINFKEENVVEEVRKITGGKMAYGAIECVGGDLAKVVCSSVRNDGTVLVYGLLSGSDVQVHVKDLIFREVKVHGFHVAKWLAKLGSPTEVFPKLAGTIMNLLLSGVMGPAIGEKFPLEKVNEAIQKSQSTARDGKVLLVS